MAGMCPILLLLSDQDLHGRRSIRAPQRSNTQLRRRRPSLLQAGPMWTWRWHQPLTWSRRWSLRRTARAAQAHPGSRYQRVQTLRRGRRAQRAPAARCCSTRRCVAQTARWERPTAGFSCAHEPACLKGRLATARAGVRGVKRVRRRALSACSETLLNMQFVRRRWLVCVGRVPRRRSFCREGAFDPEARALNGKWRAGSTVLHSTQACSASDASTLRLYGRILACG